MLAWLTERSRELGALGVSVMLLAAYHLYLLLRLRHDPNYTIQAVNRAVRAVGVESVMFNHVGYRISLPHDVRPEGLTPTRVAVHLNRAGRYFSIGMRAYYFSVPLLFWLFGPYTLVAASAVPCVTLYRLDRTPKLPEPDARADA